MRTLALPAVALLLLIGHALAGVPTQQQAADPKADAEKWMAKADSVRALVNGVLTSAVEAGAEEHPVAKDYVVEGRQFMAMGDKALQAANEAMAAEEFKKAATQGNMAWQYFVKVGTAAVLAARLVGGGP